MSSRATSSTETTVQGHREVVSYEIDVKGDHKGSSS